MKDKLREVDPALVVAERARALDRLHEREQAGEGYFAFGELRSIIAALDGLADTTELKDRLAKLANDPACEQGPSRRRLTSNGNVLWKQTF